MFKKCFLILIIRKGHLFQQSCCGSIGNVNKPGTYVFLSLGRQYNSTFGYRTLQLLKIYTLLCFWCNSFFNKYNDLLLTLVLIASFSSISYSAQSFLILLRLNSLKLSFNCHSMYVPILSEKRLCLVTFFENFKLLSFKNLSEII